MRCSGWYGRQALSMGAISFTSAGRGSEGRDSREPGGVIYDDSLTPETLLVNATSGVLGERSKGVS